MRGDRDFCARPPLVVPALGGTGPGRGLPGCVRLNAVKAAYLITLRATMPPATSRTPTPNAKIGVRLPPDCGSDLLSAALTAGAGAGAGVGTGAGAAFGAGAGGGTGAGGGVTFFAAPPEADAAWLISCIHSVASSGLRVTEEPPSSNVTSPPRSRAELTTPTKSCVLPVWAAAWIGAHWLLLLLPVTEND